MGGSRGFGAFCAFLSFSDMFGAFFKRFKAFRWLLGAYRQVFGWFVSHFFDECLSMFCAFCWYLLGFPAFRHVFVVFPPCFFFCNRSKKNCFAPLTVVPTVERHAVSVLRSLTRGRLRSHGPVPVYRAPKNLPTSVSLAQVHDLLW